MPVRGDDNALQISDQFQRVYADRRLCGAAARRRHGRIHRRAISTPASRSGYQVPKSPVRTERTYVANYRSLSTAARQPTENTPKPTLRIRSDNERSTRHSFWAFAIIGSQNSVRVFGLIHMLEFTIDVCGQVHKIRVYCFANSFWVAAGEHLGKQLRTRGSTAGKAVTAWRRAAEFTCQPANSNPGHPSLVQY